MNPLVVVAAIAAAGYILVVGTISVIVIGAAVAGRIENRRDRREVIRQAEAFLAEAATTTADTR